MMRGIGSKNSDMPIPTRSAPMPPGNAINQRNMGWYNNDPFGPLTTTQFMQKRKPPPRPPPPKFNRKDNFINQSEKLKKSAKPTELLTNLFGIKTARPISRVNVTYSNNKHSISSSSSSISTVSITTINNTVKNQNHQSTNNSLDGTVSLIDLSPPGSPTFTTRSSSDGVSIDSFGSDGNSNPSVFTSSGSTSQTESAFEDDFDFFGNLSKRNHITTQIDPWKENSSNNTFDPFSLINAGNNNNTNTANDVKHVGEASFFAFNSGPNQTFNSANNVSTASNVPMPTIIRARPPKPPAPKILYSSLAPTVPNFNIHQNGTTDITIENSNGIFRDSGNQNIQTRDGSHTTKSSWPIKMPFDVSELSINGDNSSPPMPSIPPPVPPAEFFSKLGTTDQVENREPHALALYDFKAIQPGDLSLKQGEIVILKDNVNNEWLEGQIDNRIGIFPANFVNIIVPIPSSSPNVVNALYTFVGETWEDLSFEEDEKITVLSQICDDWLYGECNGKKGQFPANYVDRVPHNLPQYT